MQQWSEEGGGEGTGSGVEEGGGEGTEQWSGAGR